MAGKRWNQNPTCQKYMHLEKYKPATHFIEFIDLTKNIHEPKNSKSTTQTRFSLSPKSKAVHLH